MLKAHFYVLFIMYVCVCFNVNNIFLNNKIFLCKMIPFQELINAACRIRESFIARYVYTYEEFVFVTEATVVQQNDSDRTKTQIIKIK